MHSYSNLPIHARLDAAHTAITNALGDPDLLAKLDAVGFGEEKLNEGLALYDSASSAHHGTLTEWAQARGATDVLKREWASAKALLTRHQKLAKSAIGDDATLRNELGLDEPRATTQAAWVVQGRQFYTRALANPDVLARLATRRLGVAKLQRGLARVETFAAALKARTSESGEAQAATKRRDALLRILDPWYTEYREVAGVAFADEPQVMERLGFFVRS